MLKELTITNAAAVAAILLGGGALVYEEGVRATELKGVHKAVETAVTDIQAAAVAAEARQASALAATEARQASALAAAVADVMAEVRRLHTRMDALLLQQKTPTQVRRAGAGMRQASSLQLYVLRAPRYFSRQGRTVQPRAKVVRRWCGVSFTTHPHSLVPGAPSLTIL